jgi:ribonuclease P protein component
MPIHGALVAIRPTEQDSPLRCGFVVSKAVGNAVERNTVKRRLRAACSSLVGHYRGADVVVRADRHAQDVSVDAWRVSLATALDKVVGA